MALIGLLALILPLILIAGLFFVFWIIILVDSITRHYKRDLDRVVWILVIILLGLLGAFIYYFVVYINDSKKSMKWLWITLLALFVLWVVIVLLLIFVFYTQVSSIPTGQ